MISPATGRAHEASWRGAASPERRPWPGKIAGRRRSDGSRLGRLVGLWADAAPGGGLATSRPGLFPLPGPDREGSRPGRPWRSLPSRLGPGARGQGPQASRAGRVRRFALRRPGGPPLRLAHSRRGATDRAPRAPQGIARPPPAKASGQPAAGTTARAFRAMAWRIAGPGHDHAGPRVAKGARPTHPPPQASLQGRAHHQQGSSP